ncbi:MAG: DUF5305 family protein [Syntrophomonas sp.]
MVFTLDQKVRRVIIIIVSLLTVIAGGMAVWKMKQPAEINKDIPAYKYSQNAQLDYRVFFLPNDNFPDKSAGPGRGYLTPITDYIDTKFSYNIKGDGASNINGQYKVDAVVIGYILKESEGATAGTPQREKVKVWEKTTPILAPTAFSSTTGKVEIKKEIPLYLKTYVDFAAKVLEEYKNAVDLVEVTVNYNVAVNITTTDGKNTDKSNPVLVIPIKGNSYTINGTLTDKKDGAVNAKQTVAVPGVKTARTAFSIAAGVLALILLLVIFGTRPRDEDVNERTVRQLLKKYGDRVVIGQDVLAAVDTLNIMALDSFDDLVKVADEAGRAIIYEKNREGIYSFFVISDSLVYAYKFEKSSLK